MSPWWSERTRLFLGPEGGWLARLHGPDAGRILRLPGVEGANDLAPLATALKGAEWRTAHCDVVLSHRYLRCVLSEPPLRLLGKNEERVMVDAEFRRVYGTAQNLRVRMTSQPPDAGVFGAALDENLASAVEALLKETGIQRYRLRPWLEAAALRPQSGWTVLAEPGWALLLLAEAGAWRHVEAQPCGPDWTQRLPGWLTRAEQLREVPTSRRVRVRVLEGAVPTFAWPAGWLGEAAALPLLPKTGAV